MDWEWIPLGIMLVLVGSFYVGSLYLAFKQGMEVGQRMAVAPVSRPPRGFAAQQIGVSVPSQPVQQKPADPWANVNVCRECGCAVGHHNDCPNAKPKPDRRRWMGFSRIKAELENKESA